MNFRQILNERRAAITASVADPVSARIAADLGYEVVTMLSSAASVAVLGAPDLSLLTLTEMAEQTRRVTRACSLPMLVDGEQGFGNALNAKRTVEEIEAAGAAAVTIEDTVLPAEFGKSGLHLVSLEEGLGKMRAGLAGRRNPDFCVAARTSAFSVLPMDEALVRVVAYAQAGVDAVFLSGVRSMEQLAAARKAIDLPIIVGAAGPELQSVEVMRLAGVSIWLQGNQPLYSSFETLREGYADILSGKSSGAMRALSADPYANSMLQAELYDRWMADFLK